jgi:hypothetical protein
MEVKDRMSSSSQKHPSTIPPALKELDAYLEEKHDTGAVTITTSPPGKASDGIIWFETTCGFLLTVLMPWLCDVASRAPASLYITAWAAPHNCSLIATWGTGPYTHGAVSQMPREWEFPVRLEVVTRIKYSRVLFGGEEFKL